MLNKRDRKVLDFIVSKGTDGATLKEIKESLKLDKPFSRTMLKLKKESKVVRTTITRNGDKIIIDIKQMLPFVLLNKYGVVGGIEWEATTND